MLLSGNVCLQSAKPKNSWLKYPCVLQNKNYSSSKISLDTIKWSHYKFSSSVKSHSQEKDQMSNSTMKEILTRAASDPEFAKALVADPSQFKDEYQLTDAQLETISGAAAAPTNSGNSGTKGGGYE
jgi:hypothetical protein